jgi:hypothetical protein
MQSQDRSFTTDGIFKSGTRISNSSGGRYISTTPASAAKKAFSQYSRAHPRSSKVLEIHVRETTSGSNHKIFKYKVSKVKEDLTVIRGNVEVHYKYSIKIRAL